MADVIGPNGYLPGRILNVPTGMMCDDHEDRPAVMRVVGETDSFGSELIDMCQECKEAYEAYLNTPQEPDNCEWCNTLSDKLLPTRDVDEGYGGPVYQVCPACRQKQNKACQDELDSYADQEDLFINDPGPFED